MTLREALDLHIDGGKATGRILASTEANYRETARLHLSIWLDRPLVAMSRADVRQHHIKVGENHGRAVANNAMRIVRAAWNRAARQYPELGPAPTANVDVFRLMPRDYGIGEQDLPDLWRKILALDAVRRDY